MNILYKCDVIRLMMNHWKRVRYLHLVLLCKFDHVCTRNQNVLSKNVDDAIISRQGVFHRCESIFQGFPREQYIRVKLVTHKIPQSNIYNMLNIHTYMALKRYSLISWCRQYILQLVIAVWKNLIRIRLVGGTFWHMYDTKGS